MGRKIFVSYKYLDSKVSPINGVSGVTTARHYVDILEQIIEAEDHVYKGEDDDEDMGSLQDSTIGSKLGDKIFDSSVTIVIVSKGMKNIGISEKDQWIPWEISYSLKEQSRDKGKSKTNAVLAVVLPDENNLYDYYITDNPNCNSRSLNINFLFQILRENMFNLKDKESNIRYCNGSKIYNGSPSYIESVKWKDFVINPTDYIDKTLEIRKNINDYVIIKSITN